ncbi:MAG: nucleotide sugar dehydrogenase [Halobacteriovoraceae bacterium]|nr:nucleotide sugar dehydrogenase [Halobacteriovoraceae bacterium]
MTTKVAILGFGYIGSVIGAVLADRGCDVVGIEQNPFIIDKVSKGESPFSEPKLEKLIKENVANKRLRISNDPSVVKDVNIVVITVGTPLSEDFTPDLTQIKGATESIAPYIQDGQVITLKSTVPPRTTEDIVAPLLSHKKVHIAFSPERLAEGKAVDELLSIPIVVGGVDEESTKVVTKFWQETIDVKVIEVENSRTAEMVKLADNWWIDLNIAMAHDLAKLCDKEKIDVMDVIIAANSLQKGMHHVNILFPSVGVGGYCLTKDPWFVHKLGHQHGLELETPKLSRLINDEMPLYSAKKIEQYFLDQGSKPEETKLAIMGIAFKNNTGDCRFSPVKGTIDYLQKQGFQISICDPLVHEHDAKMVTDLPISNSIEETLKDAKGVLFLAAHDQLKDISPRQLADSLGSGGLVFDGRIFYSKEIIKSLREHGLTYMGVGR